MYANMFMFNQLKGVYFMKKLTILLSLCLSFTFAKENTTSIKVDGMQCSYSCAGKVNSIVQKIDGVKVFKNTISEKVRLFFIEIYNTIF